MNYENEIRTLEYLLAEADKKTANLEPFSESRVLAFEIRSHISNTIKLLKNYDELTEKYLSRLNEMAKISKTDNAINYSVTYELDTLCKLTQDDLVHLIVDTFQQQMK